MKRPAAVHCEDCRYEWHSATIVEGLRLLGSCPRCNGPLCFDRPALPAVAEVGRPVSSAAPHMVLGLPRDW
jgi:hypothetical protein